MIEIEAILGHHLERAHRYRSDLGLVDEHSFALGAARGASASPRPGAAPCGRARTPRPSGCWSAPARCCPRRRAAGWSCCPRSASRWRAPRTTPRRARSTRRRWSGRCPPASGTSRDSRGSGRAHVWFVAHPDVPASRLVEETEHAIRLLEHTGRAARPGRRMAAAGRVAHVRGARRRRPAGARAGAAPRRPRHLPAPLERDLVCDGDVPARRPRASRARGRFRRGAPARPRASAACARWRPTCCTSWASRSAGGATSTRPARR